MASLIIFMGPPGSGKGTHAFRLKKELKLPHLSTGDLFRKHIELGTALGLEANRYIEKGNLVPDAFVTEMVLAKIGAPEYQQGLILDGFPRTLAQAKSLEENKNHFEILVLNLDVSDPLLIERILGRLSCSGCGMAYHKVFSPPENLEICDACGSKLYARKDDLEKTLQERLKVYRETSKPLLEFYREKEQLVTLSAEGSPDAIFEKILSQVSKKIFSLSQSN